MTEERVRAYETLTRGEKHVGCVDWDSTLSTALARSNKKSTKLKSLMNVWKRMCDAAEMHEVVVSRQAAGVDPGDDPEDTGSWPELTESNLMEYLRCDCKRDLASGSCSHKLVVGMCVHATRNRQLLRRWGRLWVWYAWRA